MTAVANNESKDTVNMNLTQAIVKEYETTKAFDVIAMKYHTSKVKVQRILITEGLYLGSGGKFGCIWEYRVK